MTAAGRDVVVTVRTDGRTSTPPMAKEAPVSPDQVRVTVEPVPGASPPPEDPQFPSLLLAL